MQVIGSDEFMDSAILNTREKAAILWAKHVTKNTARSRDDIFKIISESFTEPEIVELTLVISYFNMNNRFVDSLHIPLEPLEHVNKIKGSVKVNPEKIRQYLENILENWPNNFPEPNPD